MPAPKNNTFAKKPEREKRPCRIMLNFTLEEETALREWAAGERLSEAMRKAVLRDAFDSEQSCSHIVIQRSSERGSRLSPAKSG